MYRAERSRLLQLNRGYSLDMANTVKKSAPAKKSVAKKSVAKKSVAKKSATKVEVKQTQQGVDWRSLYLYAVSLITLLVCLIKIHSAQSLVG